MGDYVTGQPWSHQYSFNLTESSELTGWTTDTDILYSVSNLGVAVVDGYAFVMGGYNSTSKSGVEETTIDANGDLGSWAWGSGLPNGMSSHQVFLTTSRIYLVAYKYSGQPYVNTWYATLNGDGTWGTWTAGNSLPGALHSSRLLVTSNRVYLLGGINGTGTSLDVYYADVDTSGVLGSWQNHSEDLPVSFNYSTLIKTENKVYCIGCGGFTSVIYEAPIVDEVLGSWTVSTNAFPTALNSAASVVTRGRAYVFGGRTTEDYVSAKVFSAAIDPATEEFGTWTEGEVMPGGASSHNVFVTNGNVYVLGGYNSGYQQMVYKAPITGGLNDYSGVLEYTEPTPEATTNFVAPLASVSGVAETPNNTTTNINSTFSISGIASTEAIVTGNVKTAANITSIVATDALAYVNIVPKPIQIKSYEANSTSIIAPPINIQSLADNTAITVVDINPRKIKVTSIGVISSLSNDRTAEGIVNTPMVSVSSLAVTQLIANVDIKPKKIKISSYMQTDLVHIGRLNIPLIKIQSVAIQNTEASCDINIPITKVRSICAIPSGYNVIKYDKQANCAFN